MTERRINISRKLNDLKQLDRAMQIFGAAAHRYKSNKVSEAELKCFEEKIGITLPSDFKDFLLNIDTGAGPDYGIYSFDKMLKEYEEWSYCLDHNSKLSNPCELTNADAYGLIEKKQNNPSEFHYKRLRTANGILPIQTEGCTYCSYIILGGEQHGKIWSLDSNEFDTLPAGLITEFSFLDWFESWIDKSMSKLAKQSNKRIDENKNANDSISTPWWKRIF
jgi:hypothetical protein